MKDRKVKVGANMDRAVLHLLHRAGQCADELFARSADAMDVTPRQLVVLAAISRNPNCSQTDIVNVTGIDRSTIAEMIRRLADRKLINRQRSKQDSRAYVVNLTSSGNEILRKGTPLARRVDDRITSVLGPKRADQLLRSLSDIVEDLPQA